MEKLLPEQIDPYRHAEQGLTLEDQKVRLADLERLKTLVIPDSDQIVVTLTFGVDKQGEQNVTFVKGHLKTQLKLQCQRCMEPFNYEIMSDFTLGIVKDLDEAQGLAAPYEPALVKDGMLALRELIEDEIILNLPIIPRHEPEDCKVKLPVIDESWEDDSKKRSPFHVLASLKDKR